MSGSRIVALAGALLVALTAIASTIFWVRLPGRLPTDDDYRRVNDLIASRKQPGDVVVLAPGWADRGRQFLTAVPSYAGDDLAHDDFAGAPREWLVALPGVPHFSLEEARRALLSRGTSAAPGERVGELYVEPFAIAGWSFLGHAGAADVSIGGARPEVCRPTGNGTHQCSRGPWNRVGPGWFIVNDTPVYCLWAHPIGLDPLTITYHDVPVPPGSHLKGWGGLVGQASAGGGAPIDLSVLVNGQPADSVRIANALERQPFDHALAVTGDHATVTFLITTPDSGRRHFCFDAWVQPPG